jgi:hypothetical protein
VLDHAFAQRSWHQLQEFLRKIFTAMQFAVVPDSNDDGLGNASGLGQPIQYQMHIPVWLESNSNW